MYDVRGTKRAVRTSSYFPTILGILIVCALLFASAPAHAAQLTLAWNPVSYSGLTGYCLSLGSSSGSYNTNIDVSSSTTSYTVTGLSDATKYYFAVKACSTAGDSAYSSEVNATTPAPVVNNPPVASATSVSTQLNTAVNGVMKGSDPNGDALTFTVVSSPAHGSVSVTNASTGAFTYTPATNYSGSDSFTFRVSDGKAQSGTATVSISIAAAANNPPVASATSISTQQNTAVNGVMKGSDPDGNALTFTVASSPAHGSVTAVNASTGAFTYTPATNYSGSDSFTFRVSDGKVQSGAATVSITITATAVNRAPVAKSLVFETELNTPVSGAMSATDADNDPLTYSITAAAAKGTVKINNASTGSFTYTPNKDFTGTDSFSYKANDGKTTSGAATVTITVQQGIIYAVNVGGAAYTDANGVQYQEDAYFQGGTTGSKSWAIAGTVDSALFNQYRYGTFSYAFPVANGNYIVKLRFAEIFWDGPGLRIFDVNAQGEPILTDLDIYSKVGKAAAYDVDLPVTVSNGMLKLDFFPLTDNALLNAIVVSGPPQAQPFTPIGINAGGSQYVDQAGIEYQADTYFTGGKVSSKTSSIANTIDDALYQKYRYGNMSYAVAVPNGTYQVTLKFAEIFWNATGRRVFDVSMEGILVLNDLDIYAKANRNTALDYSFDVTVTDGMLNILFTSVKDNALVSAILIQKQ